MPRIRYVCEPAGQNWHYQYEDQTTIDENVTCPTHPTASTRDFVIVAGVIEE